MPAALGWVGLEVLLMDAGVSIGSWGWGGGGDKLDRLVGSEVDRSTGRIRDIARTVQNEQKTKNIGVGFKYAVRSTRKNKKIGHITRRF